VADVYEMKGKVTVEGARKRKAERICATVDKAFPWNKREILNLCNVHSRN